MGDIDRQQIIGYVLLGLLFIVFFGMNSRNSIRRQVAEQQITDSLAVVAAERLTDSLSRAAQRDKEILESVDNSLVNAENLDSLREVVAAQERMLRMGSFSKHSSGTEALHELENDKLKVRFSSKGGRVHSVLMKEFKDFNQDSLLLISGDDSHFNYTFYADRDRRIETDSLYITPTMDDDGKGIRFRIDAGDDRWMEQQYRLEEGSYLVDYKLVFHNFNKVVPASQPFFELTWDNLMRRQETNLTYERQTSKAYISYMNDDRETESSGEKEFDGTVKWISFVDQFFNTTLISETGFSDGRLSVNKSDIDSAHVKDYQSKLFIQLNDEADWSYPMQFCFAPNDIRKLKEIGYGLDNVVPTGVFIFRACNRYLIIPLFHFLNKYIANYGLIILILTLIIKLALSPLTYRSYMSMAKMKALKPEMDTLKEKYGEDQQRMSQETMKLYSQTGVNPIGGCLPQLLQLPILIAMYRFFPNSIELRHESFLWATDLSTYDVLLKLPFEIPQYGSHVSGFTLLMTISSLAYARLNSSMTSGMGGGQMQKMQYIFPFFLLFIFNKWSSALTFYYFLQNVISFGQQYFIKKFFINEDELHAQIQESKKKPKKKSKWASRFESYAKTQQEMAAAKAKPKKLKPGTKKPKK